MFDESSKTDLVCDYIIFLFYPLDVYTKSRRVEQQLMKPVVYCMAAITITP